MLKHARKKNKSELKQNVICWLYQDVEIISYELIRDHAAPI